jgi:hypothetical protein
MTVSLQSHGEQQRWVRLGGAIGKTLERFLFSENSNVEYKSGACSHLPSMTLPVK